MAVWDADTGELRAEMKQLPQKGLVQCLGLHRVRYLERGLVESSYQRVQWSLYG